MMLKSKQVFIIFIFILLGLSMAQPNTRAAISGEPLFQNLIGNWAGEGWTMLGPDNRVEFTQTEIIEAKANGHVVVVEGFGTNKETGVLTFQSFGLFSFDLINNKYQFTAYQTSGYSVSVEPELSDDGFRWGFDTGRGLVRFTAQITETNWSQIGEFSPDGGENWFQNFEMNLTKTE